MYTYGPPCTLNSQNIVLNVSENFRRPFPTDMSQILSAISACKDEWNTTIPKPRRHSWSRPGSSYFSSSLLIFSSASHACHFRSEHVVYIL